MVPDQLHQQFIFDFDPQAQIFSPLPIRSLARSRLGSISTTEERWRLPGKSTLLVSESIYPICKDFELPYPYPRSSLPIPFMTCAGNAIQWARARG